MTVVCQNPVGETHRIADGQRRLEVRLGVDWGDDDLREPHEKDLVFCSFACLASWAQDRAERHDGERIVEGPAA